MDWTQPSRTLLRRFAAIFLFARTRNLREQSSGLGGIFLQFRAAEYLCRALVHAGRPIAESRHHWLISFFVVDPKSWVGAIFSRCDRDLAIDPDQGHKH